MTTTRPIKYCKLSDVEACLCLDMTWGYVNIHYIHIYKHTKDNSI